MKRRRRMHIGNGGVCSGSLMSPAIPKRLKNSFANAARGALENCLAIVCSSVKRWLIIAALSPRREHHSKMTPRLRESHVVHAGLGSLLSYINILI